MLKSNKQSNSEISELIEKGAIISLINFNSQLKSCRDSDNYQLKHYKQLSKAPGTDINMEPYEHRNREVVKKEE